jgi:hypothetical protein
MKPVTAVALLTCLLQGSAIAAPLNHGNDYGARHVQSLQNDAPAITPTKRQIDGFLANKDVVSRLALAVTASQQLNKRDALTNVPLLEGRLGGLLGGASPDGPIG